MVLFATATYGIGLTPDSANYFSAADSLAAGDGLLGVTGEPLSHFPPLYPAVLAVAHLAGVEIAQAARFLSALCFAVLIGTSFRLAAWLAGSTAVGAAVGFFVLASAPLVGETFTQAMSEALFVALLAVFTLRFARIDPGAGGFDVAGLGLLAGALPMTRYIGVVLIPVVALMLLASPTCSWPRRLRRSAVFGVLAAIPLSAYLVRNLVVVGHLTGERGTSTIAPASAFRGFVATAAEWFVPWRWLMALQDYSDSAWALSLFFLGAAAVVVFVALSVRRWWSADGTDREMKHAATFLSAWMVAYSAFLLYSALTVAFNPIGTRFLAPIFGAALVFSSLGLSTALRCVVRGRGAFVMKFGMIGVLAALAILQVARTADLVIAVRAEGAGGYAAKQWQDSAMYRYVAANAVADGVLTNGSDAIYLATGARRALTPRADSSTAIDELVARRARGERFTVLWFDLIDWRPYLIPIDELALLLDLVAVRREADGAIYTSR